MAILLMLEIRIPYSPELCERASSVTNTNDVHTEEAGHEAHWDEEDGHYGEHVYHFAVIIPGRLGELDVLAGDKIGSVEELITVLGLLSDSDQDLVDCSAFEVVSKLAGDAWSVECFRVE